MTPQQALEILAQVANLVKVTLSDARQIDAALEVINSLVNKGNE